MGNPLQTLHKSLLENNYDVPEEYELFESTLTEKGDKGYQNRYQLWKSLRDNNYDVPDNYDDFRDALFEPVKPSYQPTPQEMAGFQRTVRGITGAAQQGMQRFNEREQNLRTYRENMGRKTFNVGESNNLVEGQQHINPETGQLEHTYIDQMGNEYQNRTLADMNQAKIDKAERDQRYRESLPGQLEDAYAERERLQNELAKVSERNKVAHFSPMYGGAQVMGQSEEDRSLTAQYLAAIRQNERRIAILEAERDDDGGTQFWRGFIDAAKDPSVWSLGITDFGDMVSLYNIKNKIDAAKASGTTAQLSPVEQHMLQNTLLANYAEQQYGDNRGFMYDAGSISMQALPFVAEFILTEGMSGVSQLGAKYGTKAAEKLALDGLKKSLVRNTGVLIGDVAAGWAMANTTGIFRTTGDIMQRHIGQVTLDDNGDFAFEGGKSLPRSFYEGEVAQTLEYYTEKLGEHLQLGKWIAKGADKMGLTKLSKAINYLSGNKWLERGGIQDYPSEVVEEQANLFLNAILVGDNNFNSSDDPNSVFNKRTQLDIWGGMLFSIGLMSSVTKGPAMGLDAYKYYNFKKGLDASDTFASGVFGDENWAMIKEQLDNCTNDGMPELLNSIVDGDMTPEQKEATMGYAANLMKMRGFNMGLMAEARDADEAVSGEKIAENSLDKSFTEGHETTDPDLMKQYTDEAQAAAEALPQYGEEFAKMVMSSENPAETMDYLMSSSDIYDNDQVAAAADYFQKQAKVAGMQQGINDRIDLEVAKANAEVRSNSHQEYGNIYTADASDGSYYVLAGHMYNNPETGQDELYGTGGAVVVKNIETGEVSVKSPSDLTLVSSTPVDELINQNETVLREQLQQQAQDDITYGAPANEVYDMEDVVTLQDGNGGVIEGQVVGLPNAIDGVYTIQTSYNHIIQMTADELNRRIVGHNGMEVQRGSAQPVEEQAPVAEQPQQPAMEQPIQPQDMTQGTQVGAEAGPEQTSGNEAPTSALSRIPVKMDEQGKPVTRKGKPEYEWHKATKEDAAAALIETTGGDMLMARDTATDLIQRGKEKLEKIRKQKPKGDDPLEIAESRMEIKRQESEQQATIKQWQDVNQLIQKMMRDEEARKMAEREAAKSEEQRQKEAEEARIRKEQQDEQDRKRLQEAIRKNQEKLNKEYEPLTKAKKEFADDAEAMAILNDTEPRSLEEWVSSLVRPHSMLWQDASDSEIGLQSELGLKRGDMQRMMSVLGTKENGAKPFGKVVLDIYEGLPEAMKEQYTDQDVRNTLLDLFNESTSGRMMHLTEENRIAEARQMAEENARRDAEAQLEAWAEENHLTPEEFEAYQEFVSQAPELSEEEIAVINQVFADEAFNDELINSKHEQSQGGTAMDSQHPNGAATTTSETGESQVQGQNPTEGTATDTGQQGQQGAETRTDQQNVPGADVSGGAEEERRYLKVQLDGVVEDDSLIDRLTGEEIHRLYLLFVEWEVVNSEYGEVYEANAKQLASKNPKTKAAAKKKVDAAQAKADAAFKPVEDFLRSRMEGETTEEVQQPEKAPEQPKPENIDTFEDLVKATDVTITDKATIDVCRKMVEKVFTHGSSNYRKDGNVSVRFVYLADGISKGEQKVLEPWKSSSNIEWNDNNPTATWVDKDTHRVYFIKHQPGWIKDSTMVIAGYKFVDGDTFPFKSSTGKTFEYRADNLHCDNPNITKVEKGRDKVEIKTAEYKNGWVGGYSIMTPMQGGGFDAFADSDRTFRTEDEAKRYYAQFALGMMQRWQDADKHQAVISMLRALAGETPGTKAIKAKEKRIAEKKKATKTEAIGDEPMTFKTNKGTLAFTIYKHGPNNVAVQYENLISSKEDTQDGTGVLMAELNNLGEWHEHLKAPGTKENRDYSWVVPNSNLDKLKGLIQQYIRTISKEGNFENYKTEEQTQQPETAAAPEAPATPSYGSQNTLVTTDKYEELKQRMRQKLGGQLNAGFDPEILMIGGMMAAYHIEAGARKFKDYAERMIKDCGDAIRPYLKGFYKNVRMMPEVAEYVSEMDSDQDVDAFDVYNFDKAAVPDAITKAQQVVNDRKARWQGKEAAEGFDFKETTINDLEDVTDKQTAADTQAVISEAESVIEEAGTVTTEPERAAAIEKIDRQLDKIDEQLAFIGYYEADPDAPFHESYGKMQSAEKKAVKDIDKVAKRIAKDLGITLGKKVLAQANIAPIGGDVSFRIPLTTDADLYFDLLLERVYGTDNMESDGGYFRIERKHDGKVYSYGNNRNFGKQTAYTDLMDDVRSAIKFDAPGFDLPEKPVAKPKKESKAQPKKTTAKAGGFVGGLFDDIFDEQPETLGATSTPEEIEEEAAKVDVNPTEAQKEAGNYQKGHIQLDGYDITIENPKGSVRKGVDANGNAWEVTMNNHYGYIRGTEGVDGDHIDVFLSDNLANGKVFVIDQVKQDGTFDEHKVMYGFPDEQTAREAYLANYSKGWKGLGNITQVSREEFKKWVESSHRKTKPFAEYKSVKAENAYNVGDQFPVIDNKGNETYAKVNDIGDDGRLAVVVGQHGNLRRVVLTPEELDSWRNNASQKDLRTGLEGFVSNAVDDGDITFIQKMTDDEAKELDRLVDVWNYNEYTDKGEKSWNDVEDYIAKMREKYPVEGENKPSKKRYQDYITPEAKERYAKDPRFIDWEHPELAYITAAVWDGVIIPVEELMKDPAIRAAEARRKIDESKGKLKLTEQNKLYYADKLFDAEHGSAVYNEKGKVSGYTGKVLKEKKAFIVVGRPAAGKSKVFADPISNKHKARIIDSDTVKPWLEGYDNGFGAGYVQDASAEVAEHAMKKSIALGENIVLPRVGGMSVIRQAIELRKQGYSVELLYNEVSEDSSIMRAASRFAEEGRYLSLDYLTSIGDKVSKIFGIFVDKKIGDYERIKEDAQDLLRRSGMVFGRESFAREGLRELRTLLGRGKEEAGSTLQEVVGDGRLQPTTDELDLEPIFTHAEWKSNEVPKGAAPKTVWDSNNSTFEEFLNDNNNGPEPKIPGEPTPGGEGKGQEGRGTDGAGTELGSEQNRSERAGSGLAVAATPAKPKQNPKKNLRNNHGERGVDYAPSSPKARFNANVAAIRLMRKLMEDGVENPTQEEKDVLRQYSGWGGMGSFFNDEKSEENKILHELFDDEELQDAALSINTAYFTPAYIVDGMWDIAKAMGFKGGKVLEGSAGIGNIIAQMPQDISQRSDIEAVEIEPISGNILKLLYPDAKVDIMGLQDTKIPNGSVDLAITNVPFSATISVVDKADKDLSRKFRKLHDYCIAKNIRKLREGGIGIFISTSGTLDKSTDLRAWITDEGQADVVGAFRLNNKTFGGATVTSDIIVVRKRVAGVKSPNAIDISSVSPLRVGTYEDKYGDEKQVSLDINDYFKEHPEMMGGEMAFGYEKGDTFRPGSYGLYPVEGKDQTKMLQDFVGKMAQAKEDTKPVRPTQEVEPNQLTAEKEGRMLIDDKGRLCVSQRGEAVPLGLNDQKVKGKTKAECFHDYQAVQKAVDDVLQQQLNDPDDAALKPKLDALNKAYDKFVKTYGTLHKNTSISFLRNDIDFPSFLALENYSETKDIKGKVKVETSKTPVFSQRVLGFKTEPKPKTVKDAVVASIFRSNGIDLDWLAEKLSEVAAPPHGDKWTAEDVKKGILVSRLGFEDPATGQMVVRYQYLSGNVREKLAIAEQYNQDGKYAANIEELRKAVPMDIPAHLIDFSLGSSWIPVEVYKEYIQENYGLNNIRLTNIQGMWAFDEGYSYRNEKNRSAGVYSEKFRETIYGHELVAAALNNRPVKVSKQETIGYGADKTTRTVVDQAATQACAVRVDEIKDEFKQWVRKRIQDDPELASRLEKIYNEKFNAMVPMVIDDEFLPEHFEGSNVNISLYEHQKRGVMRGVTSPTMLAHEVGTGKSFTLISTAMEMRRLGTAKKPMLVVQNATVAQLTADAKLLYPNAKILSLSEKDRTAEGRRAFYAKIKYNDWDLVVVPQSTFERIPDSPERELKFIKEKIDEKKHVIESATEANVDSRTLSRMERELKLLEEQYGDKFLDRTPDNDSSKSDKKKKKDAKREAAAIDKAESKAREQLDRAVDDVQYFDDLGVDAILVDEAHEYKHLGFQTSIERGIKGIDPSYSKKCAGLYNKTRSIFEKVGHRNVVFATGTPISNTAAEIWTFMKYLMPEDVMRANDIYYFDDFVHNFGNISQMLEFSTSGKFKENTRFAAYVNKPELIRIWSQVADTVRTSEVGKVQEKIPAVEGGTDQDVFLPQSNSLVQIMGAVRKELERYENMTGKEKKENSSIPITMYGIAKRAAIDPRLVNPDAPDEPLSKTNAAVKEILADLKATKAYKGTVAVFCDNQNRLGQNAEGKKTVEWNIFEEVRNKLIEAGVPAEQVVIIRSGMTIAAKQKVFDAVNSGDIRVVLGSTQTMGTGVNMQERLHLLIHMDAPDRPMDYEQRNGRIKRQGNLHKVWDKEIRILRFGVEDSLDVTAYQRLKTKKSFIDSIMNGKEALANNQTDRTIEEEEEGLFDNPVAVLSGSQYALKKNQEERQLRKWQGKKAQHEADQVYIANTLRRNSGQIKEAESDIARDEAKLKNVQGMFPDGTVKTITVEGVAIDMTKDDGAKKFNDALKEKINDPVNAIVKRNRENQMYNDEELHYTIELDGHAVNFTVSVEREGVYDNTSHSVKTVIHKYVSFTSPDLKESVGQNAKSVRDNLDYILEDIVTGQEYKDRIDAINGSVDRMKAENAELQKRVGQQFPYDKELEEARQKVEEYTQLMKKEMEEKEAKYAEQAKEAEANGGFDLKKAEDSEDEAETLYRAEEDDEPIFYSNAMHAVEDIRQQKATPEQWLAMIIKNGGLKASEDKWLGLSDWLNSTDKKTITKQEVIDFIRQNQIVVEETHYFEFVDYASDNLKDYQREFKDLMIEHSEKNGASAPSLWADWAFDDMKDKYGDDFESAFYIDGPVNGAYTILPAHSFDGGLDPAAQYFLGLEEDTKAINKTRLGYTTNFLEKNREIALTVPTIDPYKEGDKIHFGDADNGRAVAWVRFGETIEPGSTGDSYDAMSAEADKKRKAFNDFRHQVLVKHGYPMKPYKEILTEEEAKEDERLYKELVDAQAATDALLEKDKHVLVIDEIQSKRHQDGREQGYNLSVPEMKKQGWRLVKAGNSWTLYDPDGKQKARYIIADNIHEAWQRVESLKRVLGLQAGGPVPDAPFEKNWHELAMKRMLRYAAENGYDKIAWTTGEQQNRRYSLSRVVSNITAEDYGVDENGDTITAVDIHMRGEQDDIHLEVDKKGIVDSKYSEFNKKHLSDIIGKDAAKKILDEHKTSISGNGLEFGGEGMKGFYDEMLVRFMNKYGKKWGVQVKQTHLPNIGDSGLTMWSIDITPEMRESVMKGQPMFRQMEIFNDGDAFPIYQGRTNGNTGGNVLDTSLKYWTSLMPDDYRTLNQLLDALRNQYPEYYVSIEDGQVVFQSWHGVMADANIPEETKKAKGTESYVDRKTRKAINAINYIAGKMGLDVDILTTTDGLEGKKARAKGFFNPKTGKITIVLPNNVNQSDIINTLLHEGVAHFGLRKMFGENFNTFLDNVYDNAAEEIRARIDATMKQNKWGRHEATEEYLARLAERTDFERAEKSGWWQKIKEFFLDMLAKVGFHTTLTDNELRYILWRSYDNLLHPDRRRNIFDKAREVQMQSRLKVGDYAERVPIRRTAQAEPATIAAEADTKDMLNSDMEKKTSQELLLSLSQKEGKERNETVNELIRRVREGEARIVRMGQEMELDRENDAQIAGAIIGGWQLELSSQSDGQVRGMVQGGPDVVQGPETQGENPSSDFELPIISWAKATGHYIDEEQVRKESADKGVWREGAESRVYRTPDKQKVIKFMGAWAYYENALLKTIDDLSLQNAVGFEPHTVIGYSLDSDGHLQVVLEQDFVDGITVDEMFEDESITRVNDYIDSYLENVLGLVPTEDDEFGTPYHMKDGLYYSDIHGGNMIVDKNFNRHIIDCCVQRAGDRDRKRAEGFSIEDNEKELFSIRKKDAPKKTGKGYKVFVLKNGELYPPMVANPDGEGTPIGVWLDADAAPVAGTSKTGRPQVKAGGKGTQGGSGQLAYRPGWHLGTIPYALQFNRKDENGEKTLFPNNFVWAEVEYADDVDYQDEAHQEGVNANGKYQHSLAGLKHVPTDGSYKYRTNPDPKTDEWIITGAMRVNRILTRKEVDDMVRAAGREPQKVQDGDILTDEAVKKLNAEIKAMKEADEMGLLYSADEDLLVGDIAKQTYEREVATKSLRWQEAWQDSMASLKAIQDAIAKETGRKATGAEDAYRFENRMHGRAKNMTEQYDYRYYRPMLKAFADFCKVSGLTQEQGIEYLIAKSGLERNMFYAWRNALKSKVAEDIKKEREKLEKDYKNGKLTDNEYRAKKAEINEREHTAVDDAMADMREKLVWQRAKEDYENGDITFDEFLRRREALIRAEVGEQRFNNSQRDFSGLTEAFAKPLYDDAQKIKRQAQNEIDPQQRRLLWSAYDKAMKDAYESAWEQAKEAVYGAEVGLREDANKLWNTINDATKETLKTSYEGGLMERAAYNKVRDMFDYYLPLRGWDEDKAADVYTYMGKDNVFSPAIKKAWGRTSKAENPLAYIGNIAVSTILSAHRNQMKQHFLNYVLNNPTSLVSISESWYENIGDKDGSPMWVLRSADTAGKPADEIATIISDFNDEMAMLQREGKAMPVRGRLRLDVNATKGQKAEHVVEVQRAGRTYQLYINGNPKAAQALNGSTQRAVSRISDTYVGRQLTKLNRSMAMFFTSKNPAFVVSNLSRDMNMAGASVAINEGAAYNARFMENVAKVLTPRLALGDVGKKGLGGLVGKGRGVTGMMPKLLAKWQKGKLDSSNEVERYFQEFMDEGGETGFVNMLSVDSFKEKMQKEIKQMNGSTLLGSSVKETTVHKGLRILGDTFEFYNRCAEDATRFVVYMTSRQMGKTLEESIADAKDVTLNFNRKGTGDLGNAELRDLFIFVNPALQALANMYRMATNHPLKFGGVTTAFVAGGALMPIINQWLLNMFGDDDDKESYWNLPAWVRKNNLVLWIPGTKNFLTIPLAQEFRVFYGVGEMISSALEDHPIANMGLEVLSSVADLVPINPTGNGGNLMVDFSPTGVQPLIQVGENVDFTGRPIWKENQGNKFAPMYTKAYVSTPKWMVKVAEAGNYVTGGNEGKKGAVEQYAPFWGDYINNPAVWNHLLQGYFGGMYNTISKSFDVVTTAASGEMPKVYQTPIINRFLNRPVERDNAGVLGDEYYNLIQKRDALKYELKVWKKKAADGDENAQAHVDEILESNDYKRGEVITHYEGIIKDLRAGERAATAKEDKDNIKRSISLYKQEMMEELNAIDEGREPIDVAMEQFDKTTNASEKKKLKNRIDRLVKNRAAEKAKGSDEDVSKAMAYLSDESEPETAADRYVSLATAEDIRNDARISAARSKVNAVKKEYKRLMDAGKTKEAAQYHKEHARYFTADAILSKMSKLMSDNKKLLGKGSDTAIMKLIGSNRKAMLKAIEDIE